MPNREAIFNALPYRLKLANIAWTNNQLTDDELRELVEIECLEQELGLPPFEPNYAMPRLQDRS